MSIERIIGIDFGTSTSLVKVKNYKDGQPMDGDPTSLQYVEFDGRDMAPPLIRFVEAAEYYGYEAKQNYPGSTLYKNFKLNLQSPNPKLRVEAQELVKKFFHYLHKQYAEQSGHFGQCDTERTLVSYPAKWTRETRGFMVQTAKDAGFKNVIGINEPTAALYTVMVQESDRLVKQGYLITGKPAYVLMIDMGAGTTDLALCKYTPGGQNRIIDTWPPAESGVLFGGREMDELLLKYVLDYLGKCGISEKMRANVEKQKLEDCKSWKEDSVSAALRNRQKVPYCTFIQDLMMMMDDDTPFPAIDRGVLENYCKNYISRYAELIAGAMFHAQKADPGFHGGVDLSLAVLTGGHSQWYFARDLLCGTLPGYEGGVGIRLAEDQVVSLTRPQGTVSSGMVFSAQFPAPEPEPESVRPVESALSHVLCVWAAPTRTMAGYSKEGQLHLIRSSAGEELPPLYSADSQADVDEGALSWIKEQAERESGCKMKEALFAVPCRCSMERRATLARAAKQCGLNLLRIVWDLDMAAMGYILSRNIQEDLVFLLYSRDGGMESAGTFEWGCGVVETLFEAEWMIGDKSTPKPITSYVLESCGFDFPLHLQRVIFTGGEALSDSSLQREVLKQVEETMGSRPEVTSADPEIFLNGCFAMAGKLTGDNPYGDILLLSATTNWLGVRSAAWEETKWMLQAGTTIPTKKSMVFHLTGIEKSGGIYYGEEKLAELPIELEDLPETPEKDEASDESGAHSEDTAKDHKGEVEVTVDIDTNYTITATVEFLEYGYGFKLVPENMEDIRLAAQGKPIPVDDLGDIFRDFFGEQFPDQKIPKNKITARISLEEAAKGCRSKLDYARVEFCSVCGGIGKVNGRPCEGCRGSGKVLVSKTVEVTVPAGIDDGQTIRISSMGNVGKIGEPAGPLAVIVQIESHPVFERHGRDLWCDAFITPEQAVNGGEVIVPTIDGKVSLKLPKDTKDGIKFKLKGKGMQNPEKTEHGDQIVRIVIQAPSEA